MSELKTRIIDEMKTAMKAREKERLSTIRMLLAAVKQREIDDQIQLDDAQVISTITKMIKQYQDAANQYHDAGRDELAAKENNDIDILKTFLPEQLSDSDIDSVINSTIADTGASSMKDMGKVMGIIKPKLEGKADMGKVSAKIKAKLA